MFKKLRRSFGAPWSGGGGGTIRRSITHNPKTEFQTGLRESLSNEPLSRLGADSHPRDSKIRLRFHNSRVRHEESSTPHNPAAALGRTTLYHARARTDGLLDPVSRIQTLLETGLEQTVDPARLDSISTNTL